MEVEGAGAIILSSDRKQCLLGLRNPNYVKNTKKCKEWEYFGGKWDAKKDTSVVECAQREVFEESLLQLDTSQFRDDAKIVITSPQNKLIVCYVVTLTPEQEQCAEQMFGEDEKNEMMCTQWHPVEHVIEKKLSLRRFNHFIIDAGKDLLQSMCL